MHGPLEVTNLGWKTNIAVLGDGAEQLDCGGDLVVRSVSRPGFYWGNFLLLRNAPNADEVDALLKRFAELFPRDTYRHIAIGWHEDKPEAASPFLERGFILDHCHVSSTSSIPEPVHRCADLGVLPATTDADWEAVLQLEIDERDPIHEPEGFERFVRKQISTRRLHIEQGRMTWFVGKLGGQVVGSMGLHIEDGVGRFQDVATHRDFRRRGVCSTLLAEVCRRGLEQLGAKTLVILADVDGDAWRIYRSHGFVASGAVCGVWLPPKGEDA